MYKERLKINDYVEGCEHYGNQIAYIRGWISSISYTGDEIVNCDIRCDDSFHGARGNNLLIDVNFPIRKIKEDSGWWIHVNRVELGQKYFYRVGLDKDFLKDKDVVRFFDVDGVLATFAFGKDGINVCKEEDFHEYLKVHDPYRSAVAADFMVEYVDTYTDPDKSYVVSKVYTDFEEECKRRFIEVNYPKIPDENIYFVRGIDKTSVILDILNTKYSGLQTKHCLIDDSVDVLSHIQLAGITGIHISSLLLLA